MTKGAAALAGLVPAVVLAWVQLAPARSAPPRVGTYHAGVTEPGVMEARPPACRDVAAGLPLQPFVDAAAAGEALCLVPGPHPGPVLIARPLTLWGARDAVVRSTGQGTTLAILPSAPGTRLLGFTVDGSGDRYDQTDSAVAVRADDTVVAGLLIEHAVFGVTVERARRVTVRANQIRGDRSAALGLRGDAVRLWETRDSRVEDNQISDGRDVVVWYSPGNVLGRNRVSGGRYGTHLMYSHDTLIEGNRYEHDVVGVFIMYSHGIALRDNLMSDASGAAGIGIGLKDSGDVTGTGNRLVHDAVGLYLDTSPAQLDQHVIFEDNLFRACDQGIVFLSSPSRTTFRRNSFVDGLAHVRVEGGGDALGARFEDNYFDDYAGYDLDGDGVGDVPYEHRELSSDLLGDHPDLGFFRGAPALSLVDAAGHLLPLYPPKLILVDARPRVSPLETRDAR